MPAAGGKYDPAIANQHHSWTAQNAAHMFRFSEPVIGRSQSNKENVLVIREFRLEDTIFTEAKISVRYLPMKSDPEAVAVLTLTQED